MPHSQTEVFVILFAGVFGIYKKALPTVLYLMHFKTSHWHSCKKLRVIQN